MPCDPREREAFAELVEQLGYPAAALGTYRIAGGRDGWARVLAPGVLIPAERARVLRTLARRLLVATEPGRHRLRRWLQLAPYPAPLPRPALDRALADAVPVYGDDSAVPVIVAALARLPACVRAMVLDDVAFVAVGVDSDAWFSSADRRGPEGRRYPYEIVLGPALTVRLVLHECAHAWHSVPPSPDRLPAVGVQGTVGLWAYAREHGCAGRFEDAQRQSERLAEACAIAWAGDL